MTLQQLEYIVAVDTHRHFVTAAEHCHVTQATLSMMIKKLEEELGVKIFDRSRQPVTPTPLGTEILAGARRTLDEARQVQELVHAVRDEVSGTVRIGVIPTLAPFLTPRFLPALLSAHSGLQVKMAEAHTDELVARLQANTIDIAILATPLGVDGLREQPLFYERFYLYAGSDEPILKKPSVSPADIGRSRLWLLEKGHCLRAQALQLCALQQHDDERLAFETGSLEMLLRLVDAQGGLTIVPELAIDGLTPQQQKNIRPFRNPAPVREISLVTAQHYARRKIVSVLAALVKAHLPESLHERYRKQVLAPV
ncbi:hydrogen peroxide-inducible genes activator [Flaviaesturariibacter terrae]